MASGDHTAIYLDYRTDRQAFLQMSFFLAVQYHILGTFKSARCSLLYSHVSCSLLYSVVGILLVA